MDSDWPRSPQRRFSWKGIALRTYAAAGVHRSVPASFLPTFIRFFFNFPLPPARPPDQSPHKNRAECERTQKQKHTFHTISVRRENHAWYRQCPAGC